MISAKDRISLLAIHAGNKSLKGLSKDLNLSTPQMLYDIMSGKVATISNRLANKIFLVFPEVDKTWILTGEGEMLTEANETKKNNESVVLTGEAMKIFLNMSSTISRQEENISKLTDMVNRLTGGGSTLKKDNVG